MLERDVVPVDVRAERVALAAHEPEPAAVAALETRAVRTGVTAARLDGASVPAGAR